MMAHRVRQEDADAKNGALAEDSKMHFNSHGSQPHICMYAQCTMQSSDAGIDGRP